MGEQIQRKLIENEMKESYIDYAMSVIVRRALPDVRDGLKPVHRRILYTMHQLGLQHNKSFKKSARVVGDALGKFHPHGDTAVYDALVRMAQNFSLRYPLIDGHGNFGSVDGDSAAAMRYTECKLTKMSEEMLKDIEKKTVKFAPNFDNTLKEPTVLPAKLPNLLINGSSGIAVGMTTNIPPHNIKEVIDSIILFLENNEVTIKELMTKIKGPDFPTASIICGKEGIKNAYETGRGKIIVRARAKIEDSRIIISEIPYQVNKSLLLENIADLVRDKKIDGISNLRDESDRKGMRIVIELKKGVNTNVILNQLYKHSQLQVTFGIIMLALIDRQPKIMNLIDIIKSYISYRKLIIKRRTKFDLKKAEDRAHILEGVKIALSDIDSVIKDIKSSKNVEIAKILLEKNYNLTEKQSLAILEMKLQKLTSLEQDRIKEEHTNLVKLIEELNSILASEKKITSIIKEELLDLKDKYGDERKTEISYENVEIETEDLIKEEQVIVTITHSGYIKTVPLKLYRQQKRGGRGIRATETKEEDFVEELFSASTLDYLLFFTSKGKVYWLKTYQIPTASRYSKGKAIVNLLKLSKDELVTAVLPVRNFENAYLMFATKKGLIKKTNISEYSNPRKGGIIALTLRKDDEVVDVKLTTGNLDIVIASKKGLAVKFNEKDVRGMGRTATGVRGIKLIDDELIGMGIASEDSTLLTITENGYGKRTKLSEYRLIKRGGKGVRNIKCTERNGKVVGIKVVNDSDDVMFITKKGVSIRTSVKGISLIGRNTQGVRLIKLEENDKVASIAKIIKE